MSNLRQRTKILVLLSGSLFCCNGKSLPETPKPSPDVITTDPLADLPLGEGPPARLRVVVHARYPHEKQAFTQGLVWSKGRLFESTGQFGESSVREVELQTGRVLRIHNNSKNIFAEGLALVDDTLFQLSWQNGRAFSYRRDDFEPLAEFRYDTEGWGLCFDGKFLVMSDGSARLFFRDPKTFVVDHVTTVFRDDRPQDRLNELECVGEHVYANIWQTDEIVRIRAHDGKVDAIIDAKGLLSEAEAEGTDVMNGIAFVPERGRFLITGKLWPIMFEASFEPAP